MTRRGEVRRSVARGQSGLVLGEVETLEWATRIGFEARLANTRLRIFWVTEDAQHPKFCVEFVEALLAELRDVTAPFGASLTEAENLFDFIEGEPDCLRLFDKENAPESFR